jgi:ABC-2 type transport system ATP-binding protein
MPAAIETTDLGKLFRKRRSLRDLATRPFRKPGKVRALAEVTLDVRRGEIFGLLGPNGAGKTTLLKILSSLVTPTEGRAFVRGNDVVSAQQRVRASIGLVTSDERSFYWRLSGRENLHFFAALYNVPRSELRSRCRTLLEKMELTRKADQQFMEYSTGTKQRLAIARALLHDPPIIFMDEPTRSLDPSAAKNLRGFISETLNGAEGKTILLATHNLAEAETLCDRLAILHLSRVRRLGTLGEVRSMGSTLERYEIALAGVAPERIAGGGALAFEGCRVHLDEQEEARASGAPVTIRADVERGGGALTELLRRLLAAGATILSCTRHETSLQEVFDLVAAEGAEEGVSPRPGTGEAGAPPGRGAPA